MPTFTGPCMHAVQDPNKAYRGQPGSARGTGSSRSDGSHFAVDGSPQYPYSPMAWVAPAPFAPMQVCSLHKALGWCAFAPTQV